MFRKPIQTLNALVVSAYKGFGFVALTLILVGLSCYVAVNLFYLFDHRWIAPVILTPSHERVIALSSDLAAQEFQRRKLDSERVGLTLELRHIDRAIAMNEVFQDSFERSLAADQSSRERELANLRRVRRGYLDSAAAMRDARGAYADDTRAHSAEELGAHLIDRQTYLQRNYLLTQLAESDLSLEQTQADLDARTADLERRIAAVKALRGGIAHTRTGRGSGSSSYDVLLMQQEFEASKIELARLRESREPLKHQIEAIDRSAADYDRILSSIRGSPYLRAMEERLTIAFVPYENLDNLEEGAPVYGCHLGLVWCERVGQVRNVLDGEVSARHPLSNREMRGLMVEVRLQNGEWGKNPTLHVQRAPLLI